MPAPSPHTGRHRRRTVIRVVLAALLAVVLGFLVYASNPMTAEQAPLTALRENPAISVVESADSIVLSPADDERQASDAGEPVADATRVGLVFIAGARVEPAAYASRLSGLAEAGLTVVIVRPILGFAILDWRPVTDFTALAPGVGTWLVGGHSLGGVRACQYVADQTDDHNNTGPLSGLVLVGSYCAADISDVALPVLSIAGSEDGLSTPDKIADAAELLPTSTTFIEIGGANHASFGDYGLQPGDGTASASDAAVTEELTAAVLEFLEQ